MMAPMLLGMPLLHELRTNLLEIPVLAHPSFAGSTRIKTATLLGKIFRLYGADAVIFANYGGRFSYPAEVCGDIADKLRAEWLGITTSFPVPAGGMDADRAEELVHFFGNDSILLVGGSLLEAGPELLQKSKRFVESVHAAAEGNNGL
jgi:ribulose-bisphosphate carboxylase large chain